MKRLSLALLAAVSICQPAFADFTFTYIGKRLTNTNLPYCQTYTCYETAKISARGKPADYYIPGTTTLSIPNPSSWSMCLNGPSGQITCLSNQTPGLQTIPLVFVANQGNTLNNALAQWHMYVDFSTGQQARTDFGLVDGYNGGTGQDFFYMNPPYVADTGTPGIWTYQTQ